MKKMIMFSLLIGLLSGLALAEVPKTINFQGRLTDNEGNPVTDGPTYTVVVRLYDVIDAPTPLWTESHDVTTQKGYFTAALGSITPFPAGLDFNNQYYIGIKLGGDVEMSRQRLHSVPYAFHATSAVEAASATIAASVVDNAITTNKIVDGTITGSDVTTTIGQRLSVNHIEPGGLQGANISSTPGERIGNNNIEDNAINSRTIADGTVTQADAPFAPKVNISGSWINQPIIACGKATSNINGDIGVDLSGYGFTTTPIIICNPDRDSITLMHIQHYNATPSGFAVKTWDNTGTGQATIFDWIAIGI